MEKMKAVVYDKKAKPDKLVYTEVDKPVPDKNEVLVKVVASSLNAADYRSMRMGIIPKRKIFGADIAGQVESAGENAGQWNPGDKVMADLGSHGFGGFAEYAVAPADQLVRIPEKLSFETAAALPLAGITALQALRNKGNIQKRQHVLIVGSGGGVGTFMVQLANYFGAEITAVCSTKNTEQTKTLGARHVIDYKKEDFTQTDQRYDLIFAVNGNESLLTYRRLLAPIGKYLMVGGAMPQIIKSLLFGKLLSLGNKKMQTVSAKGNPGDLQFLAELAAEGEVRAVIDRKYPLEQTAEAMNYFSQGHARGKVLILAEEGDKL